MHPAPALAVVVVCHDSAGQVGATLEALGPQLRPADEVVIVDNASRDGTPDVVRAAAPQATVVESAENLGFAGGCHAGARATRAPLVLLLNPDAVPAPGCLDALRACAHDVARAVARGVVDDDQLVAGSQLRGQRPERRTDRLGAVVAHDDHRERGVRVHISA